jgi:hypothetical protein
VQTVAGILSSVIVDTYLFVDAQIGSVADLLSDLFELAAQPI